MTKTGVKTNVTKNARPEQLTEGKITPKKYQLETNEGSYEKKKNIFQEPILHWSVAFPQSHFFRLHDQFD